MTAPTGGRALALDVGEAGAHREARAVRQIALERAEASLVLPGAREMRHHDRLGVVERLHLEERRRATALVARAGSPHHEAFAAERLDARELLAHVIDAAADLVGMGLQVRDGARREERLDGSEPILEGTGLRGSVEDQIRDLAPRLGAILPPHDAHGALELLPSAEQLTIERHVARQRVEKPLRRPERVPEPRDELRPVPVRAYSVELLAHPPARQIRIALPRVRQQQRRSHAVPARNRNRRRTRIRTRTPPSPRHRPPNAQPLHLLPPQRLQVLARPSLDRKPLMHPRRTGARIDPGRVLHHVRARSRPLDLARLTIRQIVRRPRRGCRRRRSLRRRRHFLPPRTVLLGHGRHDSGSSALR